MMKIRDNNARQDVKNINLDMLVPKDHIIRKIDSALDLAFNYDKVKTPTLFIHSEEDYRCWLAEGIQMFTSLKYHGVEARLCMFRGENHELSRSGKPKHRVRRLEEMTNWFEKYLKD